MSDLMIGDDPSLLLAHDAILLLLADQNDLNCVKQILLANILSAFLDRIDCRLVNHIGKIGADRTAGCKRNCIQIYRLVHSDILRMNLQYLHTTLEVRLIHDNPSVETSRTQQCLVQNLRAVRRTQHQNTL